MLNAEPVQQATDDVVGQFPVSLDRATGTPHRSRGRGMRRYLLIRLGFIPLGALGVATLSFFLVNLVPSDPVRALLGDLATNRQVKAQRHALGLDRSLWDRYLSFLNGLIHGTLGHSYYGNQSVGGQIVSRLASSAELVVLGFAVAWLLGVLLGAASAYWAGGIVDRILGGVIALTQAIPDYVVGLIGSLLFFYALGVLPAPIGQIGLNTPQPDHLTGAAFLDALLSGNTAALGDAFGHLVMPVLALGIANSVVFARVVRSTLIEALGAAHVEFARARGLAEFSVVRLAYRASKIPVITYSATVVASLVGGDAIIEQIFNWQGIGQWAVTALLKQDIPAIQGFVLLSGTVTLVCYLIADLLILRADPRIRQPSGVSA